ncbi:hypothetical protein [Acanthopleuribacter pedis]|uniref:Uncharacterized protein n=1 Tax=Acanthopleuribacter pedis TaxID=442870 RepID=A0A8J7QBD4_9BACT|nr:hypothetical protein [Acanthopleuribacter pedis]MBO1320569.1 hypothetical protein [Acanthopleuribacter pedis]
MKQEPPSRRPELWQALEQAESLGHHPCSEKLKAVTAGPTSLTSAGFPYIDEASFQWFICKVPHLFTDGLLILDWVDRCKEVVKNALAAEQISGEDVDSAQRALKVIQNMVFTAAITAPSDLWLLRHVLSTHKLLGVTGWLLKDNPLDPATFAANNEFNERQLKIDLHFLLSRGYLVKRDGAFYMSPDPALRRMQADLSTLTKSERIDMTGVWMAWFGGTPHGDWNGERLQSLLSFSASKQRLDRAWFASHWELEAGYRLLPIVLALRALDLTKNLTEGVVFSDAIPHPLANLPRFLSQCGLLTTEGAVTVLGARVFERGPGPFGIVGAYASYAEHLSDILRGKTSSAWVSRGENVAASQDANRKTFEAANQSLDDFCARFGFQYGVYIEHAVGKGEATRQRFLRNGEADLRYFGADLEDAAIDEAVKEQAKGFLPANMQFIRNADIGRPEKITEALDAEGLRETHTVMVVGNGFHEVRDQSDEKMVEVFRGYADAGILLIFTEETGLSDDDLLNTAWNTYHAGFRHVHEMSGQGLRPSWRSHEGGLLSWSECARQAGYRVLDRYTRSTRTIYPYKKGKRKNPAISVTYFCVPESMCATYNVCD